METNEPKKPQNEKYKKFRGEESNAIISCSIFIAIFLFFGLIYLGEITRYIAIIIYPFFFIVLIIIDKNRQNSSGKKVFERNVAGSTEILKNAKIAIAGCGGLGSNVAVALARAGVGRMIIVDFDKVEASNLNRQHFFTSDIGKSKIGAIKPYLKKVNHKIKLDLYKLKLTKEDIAEIFKDADILIEAFDKAESKQWLIEAWCKAYPDRPIIVGSGLSGIGDSNSLKVKSAGNIYFCGDGETEMSIGLCSARVAIVANMQANTAIELLVKDKLKPPKNEENPQENEDEKEQNADN